MAVTQNGWSANDVAIQISMAKMIFCSDCMILGDVEVTIKGQILGSLVKKKQQQNIVIWLGMTKGCRLFLIKSFFNYLLVPIHILQG